MPGPVKRAGGDVILPWEVTETAKRETTAAAVEVIEAFIVIRVGYLVFWLNVDIEGTNWKWKRDEKWPAL
jgi:hypothetical protein